MKTIAQVGENRLSRILAGDKSQSPERFVTLIKSDIKLLFDNYVELGEEIEIDFYEKEGEFLFDIKVKALRMKTVGILP